MKAMNNLIPVILSLALICVFTNCSFPIKAGTPPDLSGGLTPIARWDIVPNQRISKGEVLNVGVVAFSKEGIARVSFTVSGQGYSGANPQSSAAMTLNEQTKVYEYWFPLSAGDFLTDGIFTIQAVAHGNDGGTLTLPTLPFIVNATGTLKAPEAWVSNTGSNSTGRVNDKGLPFLNVSNALNAIQDVNGGVSDGGTVYLFEGDYALGGSYSANDKIYTTNEWVTVTRDPDARRDFTTIISQGSVVDTNFMRFKGLSWKGKADWLTSRPAELWIDDCFVQGEGRWVPNSNATSRGGITETAFPSYYTDTQMCDVDYGITRAMLARNITIKRAGNDPFVNTICIINAVVDDVDPGTATFWHADGYQSWGLGPQNRIIYGYIGTNLHYQGLFLREETASIGENNAFVNMFIEMREPGRPQYDGGPLVLTAGSACGRYDHLLLWNCTFIGNGFGVLADGAQAQEFNDCSFIGNVFNQFIDYATPEGLDPAWAIHDNARNNDFLHNHYSHSTVDEGGGCATVPFWFSKSPDSGLTPTQSLGDPGINMTYTEPLGTFGAPGTGSPLLDRFPSLVPVDVLGRPRGGVSDAGAIERNIH